MMNRTFGAPSLARLGAGHAGFETSKVRPITPGNACPDLYSLSVIVPSIRLSIFEGSSSSIIGERGCMAMQTRQKRTGPSASRLWVIFDGFSGRRRLVDVRFSNRPFEVKHFQTIRHCSVDVASRARASLRNRHQGPSIMGFEDEVEQSLPRPCRQFERQVQADMRTHLIHRPARDIFPPLGGFRVFSYRV